MGDRPDNPQPAISLPKGGGAKTNGSPWVCTKQVDSDRNFPGHYCLQIRCIRIVVHALTGIEGIKATLTHPGSSEIVVKEPDAYFTRLLPGIVERQSLAGSPDGKRLVALNPLSEERLNPFEGKGVAGAWLLELPRHANAFNYGSHYRRDLHSRIFRFLR